MNTKIPKRIRIIDVSMRDGLQREEQFIPLEDKLSIAAHLLEAGATHIEVGSLSHVAYVPQFRDIDDLLMRLPRDNGATYTVLALTPKAIERAVALIERGAPIHRVLTGQIATSEAYAMKNMNRTHAQLFEEAARSVKLLHDAGVKKVVGNIGTIFGCPIQGEVPLERAYTFMERMFDIGFDEVEHSDPDGIATPDQIETYFREAMRRIPDPMKHSFHMHDIRGTGIACYYAALNAGVRIFDCALGGIGGQVANVMDGEPIKGIGDYYFKCRHPGLVSTEDFVSMVNAMGIETGIDTEGICRAGKHMEHLLGRPLHAFSPSVFFPDVP